MTTTMNVVPMGPGEFGVELTEGHERTGHTIRVPQGFLDDLFPAGVDQEQLVRQTIEFLLEREPSTSILREFSLDDVQKYFPEYPEEIQRRLA